MTVWVAWAVMVAFRGGDAVTVHLDVAAPGAGAIYLAGDRPEVGGWRPDGLRLGAGPDGRHRLALRLPRDARLLFKFTTGSWSGVEKASDGAEIPNRHLAFDRDRTESLAVARWSEGRRSTVTGELRIHERFASRILEDERTLRVWLPPDYEKDSDRRHPVLYLQDGQNLFDAGTAAFGVEWQVDETADRLIRAGRVRPWIVVGIDNTPRRIAEYTPSADPARAGSGRGADYVQFVASEVKPWIDRTYRTDPRPAGTAIGGSSLGGLLALAAGRDRPEVFGACLVASPSLWWDDERLLRAVETAPRWEGCPRVLIGMGGREPGHERARRLGVALERAGLVPGRGLFRWEPPEGTHDERSWAGQFEDWLVALDAP